MLFESDFHWFPSQLQKITHIFWTKIRKFVHSVSLKQTAESKQKSFKNNNKFFSLCSVFGNLKLLRKPKEFCLAQLYNY